MTSQNKESLLAGLRDRIRRLEGGAGVARPTMRFGLAAIDGHLPGGGLAAGGLHEIAGAPGAAAADGFTAVLAARFAALAGIVLWVQPRREAGEAGLLYGPAMAAFGLSPGRLLMVAAGTRQETLWALEEGLRNPAVTVVVGELDQLPLAPSRRLHLAAEATGATALILRRSPAPEDFAPNAALSRWAVSAGPAMDGAPVWRLRLWRLRGGRPGEWRVRFDEETLRFDLAAPLADGTVAAPARAGRAGGA
ncbi:ImuA family protein [Oceanibacterium hippocampi]|uniref:SOS cell division inhibitor n=1 Tax=Oceanibacterium hippocampi TaxID=745714 RepID=A0A1Y5SEL4_9PROT|nr:hypothetical protein [Oceanibacterium hippocampi]SLN38993.1 hypothetical protein OCH7691_01624 [Oceanibacterium hippocampi]